MIIKDADKAVWIGGQKPRKPETMALIKRIQSKRGVDRWHQIRKEWLVRHPGAVQAHLNAVREAAAARDSLMDKQYGRTKATMGLAHGTKHNKNVNMRFTAILPETLMEWLIKFDYTNLGLRDNKENSAIWRMVWEAFPEYKVPREV